MFYKNGALRNFKGKIQRKTPVPETASESFVELPCDHLLFGKTNLEKLEEKLFMCSFPEK